MPIYVYACEACGATEEHIQKLSDPPMTVCGTCGEQKLEKQLTTASPHFKGGGWASDGYSQTTMGKQGGKASEIQGEMTEVAKKAARTGGHEAGRRAVNDYLDKKVTGNK